MEVSAEDSENKVEVLGENNLQYWMERSMNIISGYLCRIGFEEDWKKISDEA